MTNAPVTTEAVELTREWVEILREAFEDQAHPASKSFILSNYPRLAELARFWLAAQGRQDDASLLFSCREWIRGDKWRDSEVPSERDAWEELMGRLNAALSKEPPQ